MLSCIYPARARQKHTKTDRDIIVPAGPKTLLKSCYPVCLSFFTLCIPKLLQRIIGAFLRMEHMNHNILVVQQYPAVAGSPLNMVRIKIKILLENELYFVCESLDLCG